MIQQYYKLKQIVCGIFDNIKVKKCYKLILISICKSKIILKRRELKDDETIKQISARY